MCKIHLQKTLLCGLLPRYLLDFSEGELCAPYDLLSVPRGGEGAFSCLSPTGSVLQMVLPLMILVAMSGLDWACLINCILDQGLLAYI